MISDFTCVPPLSPECHAERWMPHQPSSATSAVQYHSTTGRHVVPQVHHSYLPARGARVPRPFGKESPPWRVSTSHAHLPRSPTRLKPRTHAGDDTPSCFTPFTFNLTEEFKKYFSRGQWEQRRVKHPPRDTLPPPPPGWWPAASLTRCATSLDGSPHLSSTVPTSVPSPHPSS